MSRASDTGILILLVIGVVLLILVALMNLPLLLMIALLIVGILIVLFAALVIVGLVAAIPFYFLKTGKPSEPGSYKLENVRSIKEEEKK